MSKSENKSRTLKYLPLMVCSIVFITMLPANANDPMRPPGMASVTSENKAPTTASFVLQQIKISADSRSAVINGQLVREGDSVSGAEVTKITSDKVVLKYRKKLRFLSLLNRTKHSEK